jgi:hypothetical protein
MSEHSHAQFPYADGDVTALGPEVFADKTGSVICWKGVNYVRQDDLHQAHERRRAKEQQLDGIRRALCDIGAMTDDDPYSHADLEDVIRRRPARPATVEVQGRCPACNGGSLFLSDEGHVVCTCPDCPAPGEADALLHGKESVHALAQLLGGDGPAHGMALCLSAHKRSAADVRQMADEELLAVPGLNEASLARIRAALPAQKPTSCLHDVEIRDAREYMRLGHEPGRSSGTIYLTGDKDSRLVIDGQLMTVSSEHPVVVQPFFDGDEGGTVTVTLVCKTILGIDTRAGTPRPKHEGGRPYSYSELAAEGWNFCEGCRSWGQWSPGQPHDCSMSHMKGPASTGTSDG